MRGDKRERGGKWYSVLEDIKNSKARIMMLKFIAFVDPGVRVGVTLDCILSAQEELLDFICYCFPFSYSFSYSLPCRKY